MGTLLFGRDETITCIEHVKVTGQHSEPLCIAYKTTKLFVGAGVYVSDDGYVLGVESNSKSFYKLDAAEIQRLQGASMLPTPLPQYSIAWHEYAFGYSLWIVIAICLVSWRVGEARKRKRQVEDAAARTTTGPPIVETQIDRFVDEQAKQILEPGETIQHQAYTMNEPPGQTIGVSAYYVVLTDRRLLFFKARVGAFGPLAENKETTAIPRDKVARVVVDDRAMRFVFEDGSVRYHWVPETRKLTNQRAFLRDVPRLLNAPKPAPAPAPAAASEAAPAAAPEADEASA